MPKSRVSACIPPLALFLLACGERTSLTTECAWGSDCGAEPGVAAAVDAGSPDAAKEPTDASLDSPPTRDSGGATDAAEDVAYPTADLADVFIVSGVYASGEISAVNVFFYRSPAALGCTRSVVAGCVKTVCGPPLNEGAESLATAGTLSVTGGLYDVSLTQEDAGAYATTANTILFHGGDPILVSAGGGDVDPFTMATTAPTEVVVTSVPTTVTRAQPFMFRWTGTSAGSIAVDFQVVTSDGDEYLECLFDPNAGEGTVPTEALGSLPAGTGSLSVEAMTIAEVSVGTWEIKAVLESFATDTRGNEVNGGATFE